MSNRSLRTDHPISMRLPDADVAIIDRAASLKGRSRTDFVREAAVRAAEDVLMEHRIVRMNPEGFEAFLAVVSQPAAVVPEIAAIAARRAPWEPPGEAIGNAPGEAD